MADQQPTPEQIIRDVLAEFVGQPNTQEVQDAVARKLLYLIRCQRRPAED